MTDRLATLMHGEVETLDIPAPPAVEILGAGRRIRRRRTWTQRGGAAVLAAAVVTTGIVAVRGGDDTGRTAPATTSTPDLAYAVDDTVYLGDGTKATMPEFAQALYYTSAGLLVRTNRDGSSDGGAPFHFELVTADDTTTKLGVTLGDVVPSVDPSEPYLAWATMTDGQIQVVVHDVSTDQDVARVDVPGTFTWGGWEAPPVSLSGDQVYVATDDKAEVVDWRTGETHPSDVVPGSTYFTVNGGHVLLSQRDLIEVLDADSGKVLLRVDGEADNARLSPDGRYAIVSRAGQDLLYDLASGAKSHVTLSSWGWTYNGEVFEVDGRTLTTCSVTSGDCHDTSVPPVGPNGFVRYAGQTFES
jgi:hypothetical protein